MIEYTIDDAIERCKDRANISALHHMMRNAYFAGMGTDCRMA